MVEDDNFAQTWYVFGFFAAHVYCAQPLYGSDLSDDALHRSGASGVHRSERRAAYSPVHVQHDLLLLMATSLNRNARLRQENQLLSMQQQRYEKPQGRHRGSAAGATRYPAPPEPDFHAGGGRRDHGGDQGISGADRLPNSPIWICISAKTARWTACLVITGALAKREGDSVFRAD